MLSHLFFLHIVPGTQLTFLYWNGYVSARHLACHRTYISETVTEGRTVDQYNSPLFASPSSMGIVP